MHINQGKDKKNKREKKEGHQCRIIGLLITRVTQR